MIVDGVVDSVHWSAPLSSPDASVRAKGLDGLTALKDCAKVGGTTALLVPAVVNASMSYDDAWKCSQEEIRKVLSQAKELGVICRRSPKAPTRASRRSPRPTTCPIPQWSSWWRRPAHQGVKVTGFDHSILEFPSTRRRWIPPLDGKLFQFQVPKGAELVEAGQ